MDGEDALGMIRELQPDLVITDLRMPVIDGLQLIVGNANDPSSRTEFIIFSGHEDFEAVRGSLRFQVRDYWLKPIDPDEIHKSLRKLRAEWERREVNALSGTGTLEVPFMDEQLVEAEEALLHALNSRDSQHVRQAVERIALLAEMSCRESDSLRQYGSNLLLELIRRSTSDEASGTAKSELAAIAAALLSDHRADWRESLTEACLKAADRLATLRQKLGPAGEAARYARLHYSSPIRLQDVAGKLHFQPAYLGQLFRKTYGVSFHDYLHRVRVEEARKLLLRGLNVSEVALRVGYKDPELFSAKFKQFTGDLPSRFKLS